MNTYRKIAAALLIILAAVMIYLGINKNMLPPALTGAGFIIIAIALLPDKK